MIRLAAFLWWTGVRAIASPFDWKFQVRTLVTLLMLAVVQTLPTGVAHASCGLDQCPVPEQTVTPGPWRLSATTRVTRVAPQAWYAEGFLGLTRQLAWGTALGLIVPGVHNAQGDESLSGLGNTVIYGEWRQKAPSKTTTAGFRGRVGLQLEIPTAQDEALGDGHYLLMPYGGLGYAQATWDLRTTLGLGQSLSGGHHHHHHHEGHQEADDPPSQGVLPAVNPHSSTELLFRGSLGYRVDSGPVHGRLGFGIDGVQELVDAQQTLIQAQVELQARGPRFGFSLGADLPMTEARRWQARGRVGLQLTF